MFEKILERLEERKSRYEDLANEDNFNGDYEGERKYTAKVEMCEELIEIVQEVAKEHGNGWIPCSEENMPSDSEEVLVTTDNGGCVMAWYSNYYNNWVNSSTGNEIKAKVIAWQPLPAPYQKGE